MSLLSHQFMLAKDADVLPSGYPQRVFADFYLATAPDLPVIPILSEENQAIGLLLGWPVTLNGIMLTPTQPLQLEKCDDSSAFEQAIFQLGGRWVCLSLLDGGQFYTDAMASQPCIYCPQAQLVLSSAALLPSPWREQLDHELMATVNVSNSEHFYLFATLPQKNCYRLLANHKIMLHDFSVLRHWPKQFATPQPDLAERANCLSTVIQAHIKACVHNAPTKIGLSAGYETRLMLACAKPWLHQLKFWTRKERKTRASLDQIVAAHLARTFKLRHEFVVATPDNNEPQSEQDWLERTGHCIGGSALHNRQLIDMEQGHHFALTGIGGELCRAFYWPATGLTGPLTAGILHLLSGVPQHAAFKDAAEVYLRQLPDLPVWQQLGLFYLENRVGAYASVHKYGNKNGITFIYPLNHRLAVEAMVTLPLAEQQQNELHRAVIRQRWPELDELPYNESLHPLSRTFLRLIKWLKNQLRVLRKRI